MPAAGLISHSSGPNLREGAAYLYPAGLVNLAGGKVNGKSSGGSYRWVVITGACVLDTSITLRGPCRGLVGCVSTLRTGLPPSGSLRSSIKQSLIVTGVQGAGPRA